MSLFKNYPPEGFIKQKYQFMVVNLFINAIFSNNRNLREGFGD